MDRNQREYFDSLMNIEKFDLSLAEITSNEFFECVFNFKNKVSHLYATMSNIGNATVLATINVVEPIKGDFIHNICSNEPCLRDEAFWCMGLYITDANLAFQSEWLTMVFKSLKYAGEKDEVVFEIISNIEYNHIWPIAEETAKFCSKDEKNTKDYNRNCEIMATVAQATWKAALPQDTDILDALQKIRDEEIQKISKCLTKSKKILAIDLIHSCLSSVQELFNFIPEHALDVFKAYYIYAAWEILEVIVSMIQIAQNTVNNFEADMKPCKMNNRISEIYSNIQYFIREFNLSNLFVDQNLQSNLNFLNQLMIPNLTSIIYEYYNPSYVGRKIFISRLMDVL
jgi:flagellar biosynthesis/type III secretory pathway chaperone